MNLTNSFRETHAANTQVCFCLPTVLIWSLTRSGWHHCCPLITSLLLNFLCKNMKLTCSAKFSWIDVLQNFQKWICGSRIPVSHMHTLWSQSQRHAWLFASKSRCFLFRGKLHLGPSQFRSLELINYASQARDTSHWQTQWMSKELTKAAPRIWKCLLWNNSGEPCPFDVHAIV